MSFFCTQSEIVIQSLVELESVIVATAPYFEHTAPLTYSLWAQMGTFFIALKEIVHRRTSMQMTLHTYSTTSMMREALDLNLVTSRDHTLYVI